MVQKQKTRRSGRVGRQKQKGGAIVPTEPTTKSQIVNGYEYASAEHAGYKEYNSRGQLIRYNEDRSGVVPLGTNGLLVIVCDGHGGNVISDTVFKQLPPLIQGTITDDVLADPKKIEDALKGCFASVVAMLEKLSTTAIRQGTTCTVVVVSPTHIVAGYVGDSPAVVMTKAGAGGLVAATKDHDFENEAEVKRLMDMYAAMSPYEKSLFGPPIKHDGVIKRLMGGLAMSRSLGDLQYIPYISAEPEFVVVDRTAGQRLVVASDSFTEDFVYKVGYNGTKVPVRIGNVLGPLDIVKEVTPILNSGEGTLEDRVRKITTTRLNRFFYPGSGYQNDNTTIVVVELPDPVETTTTTTAIATTTNTSAPLVPTQFNMPRGIHVGGKRKKHRTQKQKQKQNGRRRH